MLSDYAPVIMSCFIFLPASCLLPWAHHRACSFLAVPHCWFWEQMLLPLLIYLIGPVAGNCPCLSLPLGVTSIVISQNSWLSERSGERCWRSFHFILTSSKCYLVRWVWAASLGAIIFMHAFKCRDTSALEFTYSLKKQRQLRGSLSALTLHLLDRASQKEFLGYSHDWGKKTGGGVSSTSALSFTWGL